VSERVAHVGRVAGDHFDALPGVHPRASRTWCDTWSLKRPVYKRLDHGLNGGVRRRTWDRIRRLPTLPDQFVASKIGAVPLGLYANALDVFQVSVNLRSSKSFDDTERSGASFLSYLLRTALVNV
jgi:hypothetical protein